MFRSISLLALCMQMARAQLSGCGSPGIDCPTGGTLRNIYSHDLCYYDDSQYGIGVVSFDSNITTDGPLTWTLTSPTLRDNRDSTVTSREILLGTPLSLHLRQIANFGGCAMSIGGYELETSLAAALDVPESFTDFDHFGCQTVLGPTCPQDLRAVIQERLIALLTSNFTILENSTRCETIATDLIGLKLPESCKKGIGRDTLAFEGDRNATDLMVAEYGNKNNPSLHTRNCTMSTGGPDYNFVGGYYFSIIAERHSDYAMRFINGTTPIITTFFNEPWKWWQEPAPFLTQPEVHLSCVRLLQTIEEAERTFKSDSRTKSPNIAALSSLLLASAIWHAV